MGGREHLRKRTLGLMLVIALCGCGSDSAEVELTDIGSTTMYGLERTSVSDPVFVGDRVVASAAPANPDYAKGETSRALLVSIDLARRTTSALVAASHPERCSDSEQLFPAAVSDSEIAYVDRCWDQSVAADRASRIMILNIDTGEQRVLARDLHLSTFRPSFVTGGRWGIVEVATPTGSELVRLDARGSARPLGTPGVEVEQAALSPSGKTIAVVGRSAGAPADATNDLFLLTSEGVSRRTLAEGVEHAHPPSWSRDGHHIAVSMRPHDEPQGIWLVRAETAERALLRSGDGFTTLGWSGDGRQIVAAVRDSDGRRGIQTIPVGDRP